jgi:hypothetical protein
MAFRDGELQARGVKPSAVVLYLDDYTVVLDTDTDAHVCSLGMLRNVGEEFSVDRKEQWMGRPAGPRINRQRGLETSPQ